MGLLRFDGLEFRLFDLAREREILSGTVLSLASARDGGLWVGLANSGAAGFFDGQSFSFRGNEGPLGARRSVHTVLESKVGTLWLAAGYAAQLTPSGDYEELGLSQFTNIEVNAICAYEDSQGRIWFGAAYSGAYYWQAGKVTHFSDPTLETVVVNCVVEDQEGQIWLGTGNWLKCYGPDLQPREIPELTAEICALLVDRRGALWIGTGGQGLARFQQGEYRFREKTSGLAGDYVNALAEDREGNLWVGTRDGLSLVTDVKFPTCPAAEDPLVKDAWAVGASQRGGVWIGSAAGVTYFDGRPKTYSTEAGLPKNAVKRVFEASDGDVYLVSGTSDLIILSGGTVVAHYASPRMVVGMAEDARGVVVSVGDTLYRAGRNEFQPYSFPNGKPPLNWVLNLVTDGAIWASTVNGIFRIEDGAFQEWASSEDIAHRAVQWICEDSEGVVWGALLKGIIRLKDGQVRWISRNDGLFDDDIYAIVPDDFGYLWVNSGRGIFRVSRQNMNDFADGRAKYVDCVPYDGPESVQPADKGRAQEHVACKTPDGRIWFPGGKGAVVIDPAHVPTNEIVPPVYINRVLANGRESIGGKPVVVPPGHGELELHFTALSFIASQKIQFRYQLGGYDTDWVEAGERRMAFYTNLKPGHYTFRVIAANADGVWNAKGDTLEIELQPHLYQTIWFYLLCVGLALGALAGLYAWRVRRLQLRQRALRDARDRLEAEVQSRTADLARVNSSLHHEVADHKRTGEELAQRTGSLEQEIEERKAVEREVERVHRQLLDISRQAGMAEVATGVLHNVGNVLNSINVSATIVSEAISHSESAHLPKICALLRRNESGLGEFFTVDPKGRQLLGFLETLTEHFAVEQATVIKEVDSLRKNVNHVKEIVAMQQSYARISGVAETIPITELVEDALRMNVGALARHDVTLVRDFQATPTITIEKHKVLQVLVNLIGNAKYACNAVGRPDKLLTVRITSDECCVRIAVIDNGVGIPPENLNRIFNHGFTTRKDGHGFGLHSGALAARELGGSLVVQSDGPGCGAVFTLELPLQREAVSV
jgi:signal transduction histidine kinase/ligand-binding sensor domain-containing protein